MCTALIKNKIRNNSQEKIWLTFVGFIVVLSTQCLFRKGENAEQIPVQDLKIYFRIFFDRFASHLQETSLRHSLWRNRLIAFIKNVIALSNNYETQWKVNFSALPRLTILTLRRKLRCVRWNLFWVFEKIFTLEFWAPE